VRALLFFAAASNTPFYIPFLVKKYALKKNGSSGCVSD
jgi:hypothetical protein